MNTERQRQLWLDMLRIRMVEEAIAARYSEREMRCPVHLSIGQEAVAVGVCSALERDDYLMSTHRAHAHYLAKGGSLTAMIAEIYGKLAGCSSGKGGSMHLIDLNVNMLGSTPIVGSSMPVAVGTAFGSWMKGESRVTAVFFGEATTEEGVFAECLNFASLKGLPVVFVCENNLYSVYSPMSVRQSPVRDRVGLAKAHGMFAAMADGNDVVAVYELANDAIRRTRAGEGPSFIEFDTYRWREHCGPNYDNDIGYRTPAEFESWRTKCPLDRFQSILERDGAITKSEIATATATIRQEIDAAFALAKTSPEPPIEELMSHVYAEKTQ